MTDTMVTTEPTNGTTPRTDPLHFAAVLQAQMRPLAIDQRVLLVDVLEAVLPAYKQGNMDRFLSALSNASMAATKLAGLHKVNTALAVVLPAAKDVAPSGFNTVVATVRGSLEDQAARAPRRRTSSEG